MADDPRRTLKGTRFKRRQKPRRLSCESVILQRYRCELEVGASEIIGGYIPLGKRIDAFISQHRALRCEHRRTVPQAQMEGAASRRYYMLDSNDEHRETALREQRGDLPLYGKRTVSEDELSHTSIGSQLTQTCKIFGSLAVHRTGRSWLLNQVY